MKVAFVWNGDRSSVFAYNKVKGKFDIAFLLTFLQKERSDTSFLSTIKRQSGKLGVPFFWAKMKNAHPEEYKETIAELEEDYGIEGIITNSNESLIEDACKAVGIKVING